MGKIKAAIFDLDGTLFDSVLVTSSIVTSVASEFLKKPFSPKDAESLLGKSPEEIGNALGIGDPAFKTALPERFFSNIESFPLFAGATDALRELTENGIRLASVSGAPEKNMRHYISRSGLAGYFSSIASAQDFSGGKISGEPFRKVLLEMGIDPKDAIAIGDAPIDAIGARKAGCIAIGVLSGSGSKEELEEAGAKTIESISKLPNYLKTKGLI